MNFGFFKSSFTKKLGYFEYCSFASFFPFLVAFFLAEIGLNELRLKLQPLHNNDVQSSGVTI